MKTTQLLTIVAILIPALCHAEPLVREHKSGARTIFVNEQQFVEVTPKGVRWYCEDDINGKSKCVQEKALKRDKQQTVVDEYAYCVTSQLTSYQGSWSKALEKAESRCVNLLPEPVACGTDGDCCSKNPALCEVEERMGDIYEGSQR